MNEIIENAPYISIHEIKSECILIWTKFFARYFNPKAKMSLYVHCFLIVRNNFNPRKLFGN